MGEPDSSPTAVAASAEAPALEMTGVSVGSRRDPEHVVLEGVNWRVAAGEFWAIGGLHTTGKTDFMFLTAGLLRPVAGTYQAFGQDLFQGAEEERLLTQQRLGLVFDGGQLLHHLTVAENVALPLCYHQDATLEDVEVRVAALLRFTGLEEWAARTPVGVPRNLQQRAGLARAIALDPDVLLVDSPLVGVDPREAAWWVDTLGGLAVGHPLLGEQRITVVVSGDDLRPWRGRADRFAVLRGRRFVPLGTEEVHAPGGEAWHELLEPEENA
jgi:ABC-type transporter Mla maintaining outer membrane lipid asymmetry ATPase subunit MlaF